MAKKATAELEQLKDSIKGLSEKITPIATVAVAQSLQSIERRVKVIPPATDRNQPGRMGANGQPIGYYERNAGSWYPVKQRKTMPAHVNKANRAKWATKAQKATLGIVGYKLSPTSDQSRARWKITVTSEGGGVQGVLENTASYAGDVFGFKEQEPTQSDLMASIGWVSADTAIQDAQPAIDQAINVAVNQILKELVGG